MAPLRIREAELHKSYLSRPEQEQVLSAIRDIVRVAPLFSPETRFGQKMSVQMTAAGQFGWISDRRGYRYETHHPSGSAWPAIPALVLDLWARITGLSRQPECCLVNFYQGKARMGLHQDRDEADFSWPVLSVSLGDAALFRIGNQTKGGPTESVWLESGDVLVLGGDARLRHHGVDRIRPGSSDLLSQGGRINLTLRVVT